MKVFFDTNVYVAEVQRGRVAARLVIATSKARWRMYTSDHVLDEFERVLHRLRFGRRFAILSRQRVRRRSTLVTVSASRHRVPNDPQDSPILKAALACGADLLVTNDRLLLILDPYESVQIVSMDSYLQILKDRGVV
jgi:putative PIN family toxin of toxin-antitoxin system